MKLLAPSDRTRSRSLRIVDAKSERGGRLGGRAPEGVGQGFLREEAAYVLTLPLAAEPGLELSVFVQGELWESMNQGLFSDDRICAIAHRPSPRGDGRRFASGLSEHSIVIGNEVEDLMADGDVGLRPRADHKIGGRPYCIQEPELEGAEALLDRGFVQLLQLDFPGRADGSISGPWPFADGMFNLFSAAPFDTFFWAFQK